MGDVKQCAWCGAKTRSECKGGTECQQDVSGPGWGCMDHIHPTTDAVINVLSHVTGQPKLAIADRELEIAAEQVCGLEDQLAALREELATLQESVNSAAIGIPCGIEIARVPGILAQRLADAERRNVELIDCAEELADLVDDSLDRKRAKFHADMVAVIDRAATQQHPHNDGLDEYRQPIHVGELDPAQRLALARDEK